MKLTNNKVNIFVLIVVIVTTFSCKKYLDAKPDQQLVIPSKVEDLQALLDMNSRMNRHGFSYGEGSSDNFYVTNAIFNGLNEGNRNNYTWGDELEYNTNSSGWASLYQMIYLANVALEGIDKIEYNSSNKVTWENVKGSALFFRSMGFLKVALTWANAFDENTAASDLGIPLRLNSDFNEPSVRSSILKTYEQILDDALASARFLPIVPAHVMQPSKPAAYALLSRAYLSMRRYDKAGAYADSCLQLFNTLIDYNILNASQSFPVPQFNNETIFYCDRPSTSLLAPTRANIDTILYQSYNNNDLRKQIYFKDNGNGSYSWKGNYTKSGSLFDGIAADEVLLTRAECFARKGKTTEALKDLNDLIRKRFKTGSFTDIQASNAEAALQIILKERRKELLMRDLRWMDLKRLNKEPGMETTLKRIVTNQTHTLAPNDNRYALPIPMSIISITNMPQNPR